MPSTDISNCDRVGCANINDDHLSSLSLNVDPLTTSSFTIAMTIKVYAHELLQLTVDDLGDEMYENRRPPFYLSFYY